MNGYILLEIVILVYSIVLGHWQISLVVIFVGVMAAAIMGIKDRDKF